MNTKFELGEVVITPGALMAFDRVKQAPFTFIMRHANGDWGEVCAEDKKENDFSLDNDLRLLSTYFLPDGVKVYIITEADRSSTTILLPEEY